MEANIFANRVVWVAYALVLHTEAQSLDFYRRSYMFVWDNTEELAGGFEAKVFLTFPVAHLGLG